VSTTPPLSQLRSLAPAIVSAPAEAYWYAIYTRARHEKAVTEALRQKGVTTFLPLLSRVHRWSDRRKTVQVSLFPSYTFVRIAPGAEACLPVLQTAGVVGFVGIGRRGIPIPDKQIEDIQAVLTQNIPCAIFPFLRVGQRIRVRGGCLDGIEGLLVALKGDRSLVLSVDPILQSLAIRIEGYDIEILSAGSVV
jgi:transcription antitermination factor NusG